MYMFLVQSKYAKIQWLQDPNQSNVDDLNNIRRAASRHFRNKEKEYLNAKIEELETNNKIKNIRHLCRGISDFKKDYQSRANIVEDEDDDLVMDSHHILARWGKHFSQLFNAHGVSEVRETEIHTAEPLVPETSAFDIEMAVEKLKGHKSPGTDQISAKLIMAGGRTICSEIHELVVVWV
jgi:hypothetical protein